MAAHALLGCRRPQTTIPATPHRRRYGRPILRPSSTDELVPPLPPPSTPAGAHVCLPVSPKKKLKPNKPHPRRPTPSTIPVTTRPTTTFSARAHIRALLLPHVLRKCCWRTIPNTSTTPISIAIMSSAISSSFSITPASPGTYPTSLVRNGARLGQLLPPAQSWPTRVSPCELAPPTTFSSLASWTATAKSNRPPSSCRIGPHYWIHLPKPLSRTMSRPRSAYRRRHPPFTPILPASAQTSTIPSPPYADPFPDNHHTESPLRRPIPVKSISGSSARQSFHVLLIPVDLPLGDHIAHIHHPMPFIPPPISHV